MTKCSEVQTKHFVNWLYLIKLIPLVTNKWFLSTFNVVLCQFISKHYQLPITWFRDISVLIDSSPSSALLDILVALRLLGI